jgi:hypothetical protein
VCTAEKEKLKFLIDSMSYSVHEVISEGNLWVEAIPLLEKLYVKKPRNEIDSRHQQQGGRTQVKILISI